MEILSNVKSFKILFQSGKFHPMMPTQNTEHKNYSVPKCPLNSPTKYLLGIFLALSTNQGFDLQK